MRVFQTVKREEDRKIYVGTKGEDGLQARKTVLARIEFENPNLFLGTFQPPEL